MKDYTTTVEAVLGDKGTMLSGSKRSPKGQTIVWNGNLIIENYGKIWFGDVNITKSQKDLQKLANELGKKVYVLRESDARFENEANPLLEKAVAVFVPEELGSTEK